MIDEEIPDENHENPFEEDLWFLPEWIKKILFSVQYNW